MAAARRGRYRSVGRYERAVVVEEWMGASVRDTATVTEDGYRLGELMARWAIASASMQCTWVEPVTGTLERGTTAIMRTHH